MAYKTAFNKTGFQEVFDPPHYELFSLRDKKRCPPTWPTCRRNWTATRRHWLSSLTSRCIHDHHCGSQAPSVKQSRTNLSSCRRLPFEMILHNPSPWKHLIAPSERVATLSSRHIGALSRCWRQGDGGDALWDLCQGPGRLSTSIHVHRFLVFCWSGDHWYAYAAYRRPCCFNS